MPSNSESVRDLYAKGLREINNVVLNGTQEEVDTALQSLDDITAMMLAYEIQSVIGRTALLNGLIVELNQVIEEIDDQSPISGTITELSSVVDSARNLLVEEKKSLLP